MSFVVTFDRPAPSRSFLAGMILRDQTCTFPTVGTAERYAEAIVHRIEAFNVRIDRA